MDMRIERMEAELMEATTDGENILLEAGESASQRDGGTGGVAVVSAGEGENLLEDFWREGADVHVVA